MSEISFDKNGGYIIGAPMKEMDVQGERQNNVAIPAAPTFIGSKPKEKPVMQSSGGFDLSSLYASAGRSVASDESTDNSIEEVEDNKKKEEESTMTEESVKKEAETVEAATHTTTPIEGVDLPTPEAEVEPTAEAVAETAQPTDSSEKEDDIGDGFNLSSLDGGEEKEPAATTDVTDGGLKEMKLEQTEEKQEEKAAEEVSTAAESAQVAEKIDNSIPFHIVSVEELFESVGASEAAVMKLMPAFVKKSLRYQTCELCSDKLQNLKVLYVGPGKKTVEVGFNSGVNFALGICNLDKGTIKDASNNLTADGVCVRNGDFVVANTAQRNRIPVTI